MSRRKTMPAGFPTERRDQYGPFRLMAYAEGYVMARRVGCAPFVVAAAEWLAIGEPKLPDDPKVVRLEPKGAPRGEAGE